VLRRVLLAALMCVAVWAWGYRSGVDAASPVRGMLSAVTDSAGHAAHLRRCDRQAGNSAPSTDVWQNAAVVVAVHTWRLDGHHAAVTVATPSHAARAPQATSPALRQSPPAPPHTFDLPLLV
jgi:hypothetical protein